VASNILRSPEETVACGRAFAARLNAGDVLGLSGDLGAGKTHFVKGLAAGLGVDTPVTSPTFTLLHEYRGGALPLFHFDFYRLETEEEVLAIGLDDYLSGGGIVVIEWAEKFARLLPQSTRWLELRLLSETERELIERA
jgi:tRNA threonylcarbamoyladenosine biosynthesis protein TsaE